MPAPRCMSTPFSVRYPPQQTVWPPFLHAATGCMTEEIQGTSHASIGCVGMPDNPINQAVGQGATSIWKIWAIRLWGQTLTYVKLQLKRSKATAPVTHNHQPHAPTQANVAA